MTTTRPHEGAGPPTKDNPLPAPIEESSFATLFPRYKEAYIREIWPLITRKLKDYGISCELDLINGGMSVRTTRNTWDCSLILKARDLIKLLARSVPVQQALRIMEDDMQCDIIKIGNLLRNKERFVKRRARLIGPNGTTLKALELLTNCYIMVQGSTVSAMGPYSGLKTVRKVAVDCINNFHPIYHIKTLMIKRELEKDPKLKTEDWSRFLPKFKKKNVARKKPQTKQAVEKPKKEYNPFPPMPIPSKVDISLETGEYFLSEKQRRQRAEEHRSIKQKNKKILKAQKRAAEFVPPKEVKRKRSESVESVSDLISKVKKHKSKALTSESSVIDPKTFLQ